MRAQSNDKRGGSPNVKGIKIPGHVNKKTDDTVEKLIQMRIDFHEQRRQQLINQVKIMRARVIQDE